MPSRVLPVDPGYPVSSGFRTRERPGHDGVDWAAPLGAPLYAPADSIIVEGSDRFGVQGFGFWVWGRSGSYDWCLGHMRHASILVRKGDRVVAGQQVASVGGEGDCVPPGAPHAHLSVYLGPLTDRRAIDPLAWLDEQQEGTAMPLWGIDISNHNEAIDLAQVKAEGFDYVFAKVTEGSGFKDQYWPRNRDAARANGLILAGYHYVRDGDPQGQAANLAAWIGDPAIPVALDFEASSGGWTNFQAVRTAVEQRGLRVALSYVPRWYWQQIGSPDISGAPGLWASNYVAGEGYASVLYPGDDWRGWQAYGGAEPKILQFSSTAHVAGKTVDVNAFKGTRDDLLALLGAAPETKPTASLDQLVLDQLTGPGFAGWPQLGGKSVVDFLADFAARFERFEATAADALAHLVKGTQK